MREELREKLGEMLEELKQAYKGIAAIKERERYSGVWTANKRDPICLTCAKSDNGWYHTSRHEGWDETFCSVCIRNPEFHDPYEAMDPGDEVV